MKHNIGRYDQSQTLMMLNTDLANSYLDLWLKFRVYNMLSYARDIHTNLDSKPLQFSTPFIRTPVWKAYQSSYLSGCWLNCHVAGLPVGSPVGLPVGLLAYLSGCWRPLLAVECVAVYGDHRVLSVLRRRWESSLHSTPCYSATSTGIQSPTWIQAWFFNRHTKVCWN